MVRLCLPVLIALLTACTAKGEYRIPYANGIEVKITRDFTNHPVTKNSDEVVSMYDMKAPQELASIRAAAPGWVRYIEDGNTTPEGGNNNYVWIEHPYPYCQNPNDPARATWPGKPADYHKTCEPCEHRYCNEWTVYVHMAAKSVTGSGEFDGGLEEDDWVGAGALLGRESNIGQAQGRHLHWHVAVIDPEWTPNATGGGGHYETSLAGGERPERIPIVCTAAGKRILLHGFKYTAAPCP